MSSMHASDGDGLSERSMPSVSPGANNWKDSDSELNFPPDSMDARSLDPHVDSVRSLDLHGYDQDGNVIDPPNPRLLDEDSIYGDGGANVSSEEGEAWRSSAVARTSLENILARVPRWTELREIGGYYGRFENILNESLLKTGCWERLVRVGLNAGTARDFLGQQAFLQNTRHESHMILAEEAWISEWADDMNEIGCTSTSTSRKADSKKISKKTQALKDVGKYNRIRYENLAGEVQELNGFLLKSELEELKNLKVQVYRQWRSQKWAYFAELLYAKYRESRRLKAKFFASRYQALVEAEDPSTNKLISVLEFRDLIFRRIGLENDCFSILANSETKNKVNQILKEKAHKKALNPSKAKDEVGSNAKPKRLLRSGSSNYEKNPFNINPFDGNDPFGSDRYPSRSLNTDSTHQPMQPALKDQTQQQQQAPLWHKVNEAEQGVLRITTSPSPSRRDLLSTTGNNSAASSSSSSPPHPVPGFDSTNAGFDSSIGSLPVYRSGSGAQTAGQGLGQGPFSLGLGQNTGQAVGYAQQVLHQQTRGFRNNARSSRTDTIIQTDKESLDQDDEWEILNDDDYVLINTDAGIEISTEQEPGSATSANGNPSGNQIASGNQLATLRGASTAIGSARTSVSVNRTCLADPLSSFRLIVKDKPGVFRIFSRSRLYASEQSDAWYWFQSDEGDLFSRVLEGPISELKLVLDWADEGASIVRLELARFDQPSIQKYTQGKLSYRYEPEPDQGTYQGTWHDSPAAASLSPAGTNALSRAISVKDGATKGSTTAATPGTGNDAAASSSARKSSLDGSINSTSVVSTPQKKFITPLGFTVHEPSSSSKDAPPQQFPGYDIIAVHQFEPAPNRRRKEEFLLTREDSDFVGQVRAGDVIQFSYKLVGSAQNHLSIFFLSCGVSYVGT